MTLSNWHHLFRVHPESGLAREQEKDHPFERGFNRQARLSKLEFHLFLHRIGEGVLKPDQWDWCLCISRDVIFYVEEGYFQAVFLSHRLDAPFSQAVWMPFLPGPVDAPFFHAVWMPLSLRPCGCPFFQGRWTST